MKNKPLSYTKLGIVLIALAVFASVVGLNLAFPLSVFESSLLGGFDLSVWNLIGLAGFIFVVYDHLPFTKKFRRKK